MNVRAIERYAKAELEHEAFREAVEHRKAELRIPRRPWWRRVFPKITITWRE